MGLVARRADNAVGGGILRRVKEVDEGYPVSLRVESEPVSSQFSFLDAEVGDEYPSDAGELF